MATEQLKLNRKGQRRGHLMQKEEKDGRENRFLKKMEIQTG